MINVNTVYFVGARRYSSWVVPVGRARQHVLQSTYDCNIERVFERALLDCVILLSLTLAPFVSPPTFPVPAHLVNLVAHLVSFLVTNFYSNAHNKGRYAPEKQQLKQI
jgi:hypothetical protein